MLCYVYVTNESKQDQDSLAQPALLGRQGDKVYYSLFWVVCLIVWTILVKVAALYDISFHHYLTIGSIFKY